jgi:hypothetical protein
MFLEFGQTSLHCPNYKNKMILAKTCYLLEQKFIHSDDVGEHSIEKRIYDFRR